LFGLFFKPVQVHRQLTNLLVQLRNQLLLVLRPRLPRLKQLGHVIPDRRPPLRHLRRMHRMRSKGLNAVRMILFDTWEYDTGYVTNASSTWTDPTYQATQLARMERSVDYASSNGLYVIINSHNDIPNFNEAYASNLWTVVAPYFANRTHVIYEEANEPMSGIGVNGAMDTNRLQALKRVFNIMRANAPNTHIMVLTPNGINDYGYGTGLGNAAQSFADLPGTVDWTKTSVAYHLYADDGSVFPQAQNLQNLHSRFPGWPSENNFPPSVSSQTLGISDSYRSQSFGNDVFVNQTCERLGLGWSMWNINGPSQLDNNWPILWADAVTNGYTWIADAAIIPVIIPGLIEAETCSSMFGIQTEACLDVGGGLDVGWMDAGDWMNYSVNVASSGNYNLGFRVASPNSGGQLQLFSGTNVLATVSVPNTGGWQNWTTVTVTNVPLLAGSQVLQVSVIVGGENLNWLSFTNVGGLVPQYAYGILGWNFDDQPALPAGSYVYSGNAANLNISYSAAAAGYGVGGSNAWITVFDTTPLQANPPAYAGGGSSIQGGQVNYSLFDTGNLNNYQLTFDSRAAGQTASTTEDLIIGLQTAGGGVLKLDANFAAGSNWVTQSYPLGSLPVNSAGTATVAGFATNYAVTNVLFFCQVQDAANAAIWPYQTNNMLMIDNLKLQRVATGAPSLQAYPDGKNLLISWPTSVNGGTTYLLSATNLAGPWTTNTPTPNSPYIVTPAPAGQGYFRTLWTP